MSKLEIIHLGHPKLRRKSLAVTKRQLKTKRFQDFIDDLCAICDANNGAGIAAPQVGVNKRVIVVHIDPNNPRYPGKKPFPLTVVINPRITKRSKTLQEDWGLFAVDCGALPGQWVHAARRAALVSRIRAR